MGLFTRLTRVGLLLDAFQHRCLDQLGLRFIDYSVLRVLQLSGPPYEMTPTELSEIVLRSSGGMTQIVDRLERSQYVRRANDLTDRRRVVITLTEAGIDVVKRASAEYARARRKLLTQLTTSEVEECDDAVRLLLKVLSEPAAPD
jgi:DNA-binding MarR family transcriptional regulator